MSDVTVGQRLREAREKRGLSLEQVESALKIRIVHLEALERAEYDKLPAGPYARTFVRSYAGYVGLDGEELVEQYRSEAGGDEDVVLPAIGEPSGFYEPTSRPRLPIHWGIPAGIAVVAAVGIVFALGVFSGDGKKAGESVEASGTATGSGGKKGGGSVSISDDADGHSGGRKDSGKGKKEKKRRPSSVTVTLTTEGASVWVCLVDDEGVPVVNGETVPPGTSLGPFKSGYFRANFGNRYVRITVNGKATSLPDAPAPIGRVIDRKGVEALSQEQSPVCEPQPASVPASSRSGISE